MCLCYYLIILKVYGANLNARGEPSPRELLRICDLNSSHVQERKNYVFLESTATSIFYSNTSNLHNLHQHFMQKSSS